MDPILAGTSLGVEGYFNGLLGVVKQRLVHYQVTSNSEFEEMLTKHRAAMAETARVKLSEASDHIKRFTDHAASRGVQLTPASFTYLQTIGVVATAPGLARQLLNPLRTERDGLFCFSDIAVKHPPSASQEGYFVGPHYTLMADPCFRRGMHPVNNWAPRFIELFWQREFPGTSKYIGIDGDRVRIEVDGTRYFEADTWYGAPFNDDIRLIPPGTVKLRPPLDVSERFKDIFFANVYCWDIKWSETNGIKTFQALEMKTSDVCIDLAGVRHFPARYLHAEFDIAANHFRHFDGAIQMYQEAEYLQRRDSDFNMNAKMQEHVKARSRKVFKLNGQLAISEWVELCCHFLPANPLTFEYFTGAYPEHVANAVNKARSGALNLE